MKLTREERIKRLEKYLQVSDEEYEACDGVVNGRRVNPYEFLADRLVTLVDTVDNGIIESANSDAPQTLKGEAHEPENGS